MVNAGGGEIERFFDRLTACDWEALRALLSPGVERIGFLGDVVIGRDAYVELMAGGAPSDEARERTTWDVHDTAYASDGRAGFARVTAHVPHGDGELQIEQALAFKIDEHGLISRIEAFWRDRRPAADATRQMGYTPPGASSD